MPGVKFILEADEAKAVRGFLKILAANNKLNKGIKNTTKSLTKMEKAGKGAGRRSKLGSFGKTFATAFGVGTGAGALRAGLNLLSGMASSAREITTEIGQSSAAFDRMIRPLAALGDNADRIAAIRSEIIATSVGFGIEAQNVASGLFLLESALGNYDDNIKQAIKSQALVAAALGGDFNIAITAGASLWLIYGDRLKAAGISADDMVGKLAKVAELAKATPEDIGRFGLRTFAAGAARGFSFQDVGAAIPFATGISGSARKATTNLANLIDRLSLAEEELGIELKGGLIDQLEQVRVAIAGDIKLTERIFGQALSGFAQTLLRNTDKFRAARSAIEKADRTEQAKKLAKIRTDPTSRSAEIFRTGEAALANIGAIRGLRDPKLLQDALNFQALKIGTRLTTSPFLQLTTEKLQELQALVVGGKVTGTGEVAQKGFRFLEDQARKAGDKRLADLIRVQSQAVIPGIFAKGVTQGLGGVQQKDFAERFTPKAAQIFAERQRDDPNLTITGFIRSLQTDPALRAEALGPGTFVKGEPVSLGPLVGNLPAGTGERQTKQDNKEVGKKIAEGMQTHNPNVGVQP